MWWLRLRSYCLYTHFVLKQCSSHSVYIVLLTKPLQHSLVKPLTNPLSVWIIKKTGTLNLLLYKPGTLYCVFIYFIFFQGRCGTVSAEGLPPVHQCSAMEGSGWNRVSAPYQTPAGPEEWEPHFAAWSRSLPAVSHQGPEKLFITVSQRGEASWLQSFEVIFSKRFDTWLKM